MSETIHKSKVISLKDFNWENLATIFALLSTVSICLSIIYDLAYFQVFGLSYFYFLSVADHLVSALHFLFFAALGFMVLFVILYLMARAEHTIAPDGTSSSSYDRYMLMVFGVLAVVTGAVLYLSSLATADDAIIPKGTSKQVDLLRNASNVLCGILMTLIIKRPALIKGVDTLHPLVKTLIVTVPLALFMTYDQGYESGYSDYHKETGKFQINLKENHEVLKNINIIKYLEKGILVRNGQEKKNYFLTWEGIASITE